MALFKDDGQEDALECPVCYEHLSGTERTLSCGHVFCHDCLVQTLVSIRSDGIIRDTLSCPVCRHLTFIWRQKHPDGGQTLEVPVSAPPGRLQSARRASSAAGDWVSRCCGRISRRVGRRLLMSPSRQNACQVFIISAQGRPMAEEDAHDVVLTVVRPRRRRRARICTTARCLLFLLSSFTVLALAAATLPWILLA